MATASGYCDVPVASLPLPTLSLPVPSVLPESAPETVAADAVLQHQLDELKALQAHLARLSQTWCPDLDDTKGPHPRLIGACVLAPTLLTFQRDLDGLARQCGTLIQWTQARLDRTRCGVRRLNAVRPAFPPEARAHEPH